MNIQRRIFDSLPATLQPGNPGPGNHSVFVLNWKNLAFMDVSKRGITLKVYLKPGLRVSRQYPNSMLDDTAGWSKLLMGKESKEFHLSYLHCCCLHLLYFHMKSASIRGTSKYRDRDITTFTVYLCQFPFQSRVIFWNVLPKNFDKSIFEWSWFWRI